MELNHPAELSVHHYLDGVRKGERGMTEETIEQVVSDVREALNKQFGSANGKREFRLRMSAMGRPYCQLWFDKNDPEGSLKPGPTFLMNMLMGDIVEAAFKGILKEAGVEYKDGYHSVLKLGKHEIPGTHDIEMNGRVDDIKSASPWSYENKFESFEKLAEGDSFGYVGQLAAYSESLGLPVGGWWVINKATGAFKYVDASSMDKKAELKKIEEKCDKLENGEFERCFEPVKETFRRNETGNVILNSSCKFCDHKYKCWPDMVERPSVVSKAKEPPMVQYIKIHPTYLEEE